MQPEWEKIEAHYNEGYEHQRVSAEGRIERLRTLDILDRFLPPAPRVVYDVGGGAGVYASYLANKGYKVHLVDPVQLHIDQANEVNNRQTLKIQSIAIGNALNLNFDSNSADCVLYFGPLYHLIEKGDRLQALSEAFRVLKPGGQFMAVGVSKFASLIDLFGEEGYLEDERVKKMVEQDIKNGQHRCPEGTDCWTTAFMHHPDGLRAEVAEAGFRDVKMLAIEGPIWEGVEQRLEKESDRKVRLELLRLVEQEPTLIGASAHIMAIGTKA